MEKVESLFSDIWKSAGERFSNPFIITFIITWIVQNKKFVLMKLFAYTTISQKASDFYDYLSNEYGFLSFVWTAILTLLVIGLFQGLSAATFWIIKWFFEVGRPWIGRKIDKNGWVTAKSYREKSDELAVLDNKNARLQQDLSKQQSVWADQKSEIERLHGRINAITDKVNNAIEPLLDQENANRKEIGDAVQYLQLKDGPDGKSQLSDRILTLYDRRMAVIQKQLQDVLK